MKRSAPSLLTNSAAAVAVGASVAVSPALGLLAAGSVWAAVRPRLWLAGPSLLLPWLAVFPIHMTVVGYRVPLLWPVTVLFAAVALAAGRNYRRLSILGGVAAVLVVAAVRARTPDSELSTWTLVWLVAAAIVICEDAQLRWLLRWGLPSAVFAAGVVGALQATGHAPAVIAAHFQWSGSVFVEGGTAQHRIRGTFPGENAFGLFLAVTWPFLIERTSRMRVSWWIKLLANVPLAVALLATLSRASWLAGSVGASMTAFSLLRPHQRLALAIGAASIASCFGLVLADRSNAVETGSVYTQRAMVTLDSSYPANSLRLQTYGDTWRAIERRAVLGYGADQLKQTFRQTTGAPVDHAHDVYLQVLLEFGIVGLAAFAAPVVRALARARRDSRAALVALLVGGVLDYLEWSEQIALTTGIVLGVALAVAARSKPPMQHQPA